MLSEFKNTLTNTFPFLKEKKLLIATSGGIDSMVLVHLLQSLNYTITIAHCNFGLRGKESDGDEQFIREYAKTNNIKIFVTRFDTDSFSKDNKLSIQVAARKLRYIWFSQLLAENDLDYLLTAHHLDDSLETFLINLSRGTGLEGLIGIPQHNDTTLRPLLNFSRSDIEMYAKANSIQWREDSSNASDKYLRNRLRHDVVPVLKSLNVSFMESFKQTLQNLQQSQSLAEDASIIIYQKVVAEQNNQKHFNIAELKRLPNYKAYLYQWLSPFGFTAWDDIYRMLEAQSGKVVLSSAYRLLKNRDTLILEPIPALQPESYSINEGQEALEGSINLKLAHVDTIENYTDNNVIYVDALKLKFPLFVRKWQEGDYFYPTGMNGQKKKLSKYFKDEKMSLSDKESTWLLCSDNQVVWVIKKRADERFKATAATTKILKIEVL